MTDTRTSIYCTPYDVGRHFASRTMPSLLTVTLSTDEITFSTAADARSFVVGDEIQLTSAEKPHGERFIIQDRVSAGVVELNSTPAGHTTTIKARKMSWWMSMNSLDASVSAGSYKVTKPSAEEVISFIEDAQEVIEEETGHSWRAVSVEEVHDFPFGGLHSYSYLDGAPIPLEHRSVRAFSAASGDKIEVHNGSTGYTDMTTGGTWTEGHVGGRFWFEYDNGILYIKHTYKIYIEGAIRVTYRYGESTVPKDIREATAIYAAMRLHENDWGVGAIPEAQGEKSFGIGDKMERLDERFKAIIR